MEHKFIQNRQWWIYGTIHLVIYSSFLALSYQTMATKTHLDSLLKTYRSIASYPRLSSAILAKVENGLKIISFWSQRNLERGTSTKIQCLHFVDSLFNVQNILSTDISSESLLTISKSGLYKAVIRRVSAEKKQFLEIWDGDSLFKNFDVAAFDVHGEIYTDSEFGCLEWSPDENKLLYIAEKKLVKSEPFYKQKNPDKTENQDDVLMRGGEYVDKPNWGEELAGKHQPVAVICHIIQESLQVLEGIPDNFSPGQVLWNAAGDGIFGIVFENEPRRLGLDYTANRLSSIFQLSLKKEFETISDKVVSVRSPRLSPDGKFLLYLQSKAGGPHASCQQLIKLELASLHKTTLVNEVATSITIASGQQFYGIYSQRLPRRCFSKDATKLLFSSPQQFLIKSYVLDLESGNVNEIQNPESMQIIDVLEDNVLYASSSLCCPANLKLTPLSKIFTTLFIPITNQKVAVKNTVEHKFNLESVNTSDKFRSFNALYFGPIINHSEEKKKIPVIIYPHGGPHSVYLSTFRFDVAFFVSVGYGVLMVNYRGSLGHGQDSVKFLLGKIGDTDVKDCHQAAQYALSQINYLDANKMVLYGGSHGGFLISHLSGQYPDTYKAVSNRNGVADVAAMYTISDSPDWCSVESGLPFDPSSPLSPEAVGVMYNLSPIRYVDKVKAPTLIFIGKKDLRVPFSQGVLFYNTLKARGVKTKLISYEDDHSLASVLHETDYILNTALWFSDILQLNK